MLKMIRAVLTAVFLVGLEWKGLRCHRRASPRPEKTTPNIQKRILKNMKKKTNSITITIKRTYEEKRNAAKIRTHVMTRINGVEREPGKQ